MEFWRIIWEWKFWKLKFGKLKFWKLNLKNGVLKIKFGTVLILINHSPCVQFEFWDRTYIDRPSSCQFEFEFSSWDRTFINLSSSCQFEFGFWDRTYIDQSLSCQFKFEFLEPYLYRSIIILSVWVWFFGITPISIGHSSCQFNFLYHTYIDRSSFMSV